MKPLLLLTLMGFCTLAMAQKSNNKPKPIEQIRKYYFVLLTKGPKRDQDSVTAMTIQKGHMANIDKLYYEGKIKVAGPFGEAGDWQGIFIFDCATKEEVEKLLQTDPAISSGRLNYIVKPWYTAPMGSFVPGIPKKE